MDLHDSNEGGIEVVALGLPGVEDVHWMGAARDGEDGLGGREGGREVGWRGGGREGGREGYIIITVVQAIEPPLKPFSLTLHNLPM